MTKEELNEIIENYVDVEFKIEKRTQIGGNVFYEAVLNLSMSFNDIEEASEKGKNIYNFLVNE